MDANDGIVAADVGMDANDGIVAADVGMNADDGIVAADVGKVIKGEPQDEDTSDDTKDDYMFRKQVSKAGGQSPLFLSNNSRHRRYASMDNIRQPGFPSLYSTNAEPAPAPPVIVEPAATDEDPQKSSYKRLIVGVWNKKWPIVWVVVLVGACIFLNYLMFAYGTGRLNVHWNRHCIHTTVLSMLVWVMIGWIGNVVGNEAAMFLSFVTLEMASLGIELAFALE